jgi:hypothetical protein
MTDRSPWPASSRDVEPMSRRWIVGLALLSASSALGGGVMLIAGQGRHLPPPAALAHTPFDSFLVPGLLLAVVVGASSLVCALLAWRRSPALPEATTFAGGALSVWIVAEVAIMRQLHGLHLVYGALGVTLLWLGVRAAWRSRVPRRRWVIAVTAAETGGFLAPALAGILSAKAGLGGAAQVAVVVAAGLVEGLALGAGQAWVFPLPVRRWRYALLTSAGAGVVWLSILLAMRLASGGALRSPAAAGAVLGAGLVGLAALGTAQWLELRRHTLNAHRWIAWTALAWALALPLSFTPSPFVDGQTPIASHLALWACGGLLMAHVMALVTWQGVRRTARANGA